MRKIPFKRTAHTPVTLGSRTWTIWADSTNEGLVIGFHSDYCNDGNIEECLPQNMEEAIGTIATYVVSSFTGTSEDFQNNYVDLKSKGGDYDC